MGASVSTDKVPLKWADITRVRHTGLGNGNGAQVCGTHIKAWFVQSGLQQGCGTVDLGREGVMLQSEYCYVVLVVRAKDAAWRDSTFIDGGVLREVCTPRGLAKPWSLSSKESNLETSIYVFSGYRASGLVKATALLRGMQLERWIIEQPELGRSLANATQNHVSISKDLNSSYIVTTITTPVPTHAWEEELQPEEDEKAMEQRAREKLHHWAPLCSEILPYLFVGGQTPAEDLETLLHSNITHVVNTVEMIVDCCFPEHFTYLPMKMMDTVNEDIAVVFPHVIAFIEAVRKKNGRVFVHCQQGASRSCTLITSYMLWLEGKPLQPTLERVKQRRGIAKPNMGFYTRLSMWERHLLDPPEISVFRLQGYSLDSVVPHVFALETFSQKDGINCLDRRTVYLICDIADRENPRATLWIGDSTHEGLVSSGRVKAQDILKYAFRGVYPPQQLVTEVSQGVEPLYLQNTFTKLKLDEPKCVGFYNGLYNDLGRLVTEGEAFEASMREKLLGDDARVKVREKDILALKKVNRGGMDMATPRLKNQKLDITEVYQYTIAGGFEKHSMYSTVPMEDDEFEAFREDCAGLVFVFIKQRPSQKIVDIWVGTDHPPPPETITLQVLEDLAEWSTTPSAPPWAASIQWRTTQATLVIDGQDEDADDLFYARWVID
eukprot:TRINITY_DN42718_c0_g1_i1.p1 TRINITY_DN42718_c0_g1~~TRINITY_DN42718_c0_g1_i1.p1  ORF type:complete len:664 (+),score=99.21 TRINITY_DN42718_c0_g1_i1:79-2070(+)